MGTSGTNATQCEACGSYDVRRAKLLFGDIPYLVRHLYPTRCRRCRVRNHRNILEALRIDPYYYSPGLGKKPELETFWSRALRFYEGCWSKRKAIWRWR